MQHEVSSKVPVKWASPAVSLVIYAIADSWGNCVTNFFLSKVFSRTEFHLILELLFKILRNHKGYAQLFYLLLSGHWIVFSQRSAELFYQSKWYYSEWQRFFWQVIIEHVKTQYFPFFHYFLINILLHYKFTTQQ